MNRIVREHYPVERLPEDLRPAAAAGGSVRVVIETEVPEERAAARMRAVAELSAVRDRMPQTQDDATARISKLRDEWDR